jgi:ribonuclease J
MAAVIEAAAAELKYDRLSLIPLGGQNEIGQVLWAISYAGEILLVDAGACYPASDFHGVDLILPNTNFLAANQDRVLALLLTNGHEEHSGAVSYLLGHIKIPRILAPRFVSALVSQNLMSKGDSGKYDTVIDTVETRHSYQIGVFEVEWIQVNDAIADACALRISTPEGVIIYTSSFKLDQTPVDNRLMDIARLAQAGDNGVLVLISDSVGVESRGYTPSERSVADALEKQVIEAAARVVVVMNGTNTHRLQILFDLAKRSGRKVVLYGDMLIQTAVAAVITGNLVYDRSMEATLGDLAKIDDDEVLIIATGIDGDALELLHDLAYNKCADLTLKRDDTVVFSADVQPGRTRRMAMIMDQLLSSSIKSVIGQRAGVHVSNHASQEELKLLLTIAKPRFFVPAFGEGRHVMNHAALAVECGLSRESIFPLRNGEMLEIKNGSAAVAGSVEAEAVLYNRDQAESVTRFSVNERRILSMEGVLTIGCLIDADGNLIEKPTMQGAALGFSGSDDWIRAQEELLSMIDYQIVKQQEAEGGFDVGNLRTALRDAATKVIRSRLAAKPTIHVVVHMVDKR